jgi:murein DD-endopeptidase MepM/ murein hydrolase activator NlpD
MRRVLAIAAALLLAVAVTPAAAQSSAPASSSPASSPASGGSAVDDSAAAEPAGGGTVPGGRAPSKAPSSAASGGNPYGRPFRIPPLVRRFAASPLRVTAGQAATLRFRVDSPVARRVHVVVTARHAGRRAAVARADLGRRLTGRALSYRWAGAGRLAPGGYVLSLVVVDGRGRALSRTGTARLTIRARPRPRPAPAPASSDSGVFPVAGPHSYGDGFGVDRGDHIHMGQDIPAAEGTPVVSPRAGTVQAVGYQATGGGNYIVVRDPGRDRSYVFMHLESGSIVVTEGQSVSAGQRIGRVGSTGHSTGPHLHFEDWIGAWYAGGHAIDPLPDLRGWES